MFFTSRRVVIVSYFNLIIFFSFVTIRFVNKDQWWAMWFSPKAGQHSGPNGCLPSHLARRPVRDPTKSSLLETNPPHTELRHAVLLHFFKSEQPRLHGQEVALVRLKLQVGRVASCSLPFALAKLHDHAARLALSMFFLLWRPWQWQPFFLSWTIMSCNLLCKL